jgi:hypothetical protein
LYALTGYIPETPLVVGVGQFVLWYTEHSAHNYLADQHG